MYGLELFFKAIGIHNIIRNILHIFKIHIIFYAVTLLCLFWTLVVQKRIGIGITTTNKQFVDFLECKPSHVCECCLHVCHFLLQLDVF